ncbi:MBL fold metallo-hydrolase [Myxococcus sp. RHSTA-1-4]|uniref:MBL fold metallo-hydrolase n=1 Tax=Myxococcus sp. RHSTA-1-4 TaxID=2874601 RepID=UPI00272E3EAC|nr:MBL fold metallo-hydrolase [Myxococcus sp. RHSTA-1-4]MBZ4419140.1 MBL fold metallo-hydrolase [Myxococcus sp. RHSTA-1-4]
MSGSENTAKLNFLGHAGYVIERGPLYLAVDPWLDGAAFDNGWDQLVPAARFDPQRVTHLWFSHEHPDHFSIPAVKSIPAERRSQVTVIFQETADKRVVSFLRNNGYTRVIEVTPGQRYDLGGGAVLTTVPARDGDSCHLLELGGLRVLNFNDCYYTSVAEVEDVMRAVGVKPGEVDLMATQFSYANWVGNPGDTERRRHAARRKLDHLVMQMRTVRPRYVMPFASFVYFSHEENAYLNDGVNLPSTAVARVREEGYTAVMMRPGDTMELSNEGFRAAAEATNERAKELDGAVEAVRRAEKPLRKSAAVPLDDVLTTVRAGLGRLRNGVSRLDRTLMRLRLPRAVFELSDHRVLVVIERLEDVRVEPLNGAVSADVVLSSEALRFAFAQDFGFDTLLVNGRFHEARAGGAGVVMTLCGQFGYVRRKVSLAASILRRRLVEAPRLALERLRNRALAP